MRRKALAIGASTPIKSKISSSGLIDYILISISSRNVGKAG